ncbi:MAG: DUF4387 domain-containing protein [Orrella sp.]
MNRLFDVAKVIRSKNAGPLVISFDLLFKNKDLFALAVASPNLTVQALASVFGRPADELVVIHYPAAHAIKISMPRLIVSGSPGDGDVYGSQQHTPLLSLML